MKTIPTGSPGHYFLIVLLLSIPFWTIGMLSGWEALPGVPASALMVIVPGVAAIGLIVRSEGVEEALWWIMGALNLPAVNREWWVLIALLLPPSILAVAYAVMRLGNDPLPTPDSGVLWFLVLIGIFMLPALLEELGWTGFALEKLQQRLSALNASIVIGVVWAIWHLVPLLQLGRSMTWIIWWAIGTIALRVMITWIYNNGARSVLLAALFHASVNASWQSFPVQGSHYDPAIHAVLLVVVVALIVAVFGGNTLTRTALQSTDDHRSERPSWSR